MKRNLLLLVLLAGCATNRMKKKQTAQILFKQASLEAKDGDVNSLHKALNSIDKSLAEYVTTNSLALKATILLQLNELQASNAIFEQIVPNKAVPKAKRADMQNNWATALYRLGKTEQAKRLWIGLSQNPHYISPELAFFNLGYAELNEAGQASYQQQPTVMQEHLHAAAQYFTSAIGVSREFIDAHFYLGRALVALNQPEQAREHFLTILTINPDHEPAQKMLNAIGQSSRQQTNQAPDTNVAR